ncbi:MAG: hypothetical protein PF486_10485 [Prolixibacteraceae bacterium]|jgi:hypothetical protein|nr:hypothetical protein [Prolixibacteraceae bacterium]
MTNDLLTNAGSFATSPGLASGTKQSQTTLQLLSTKQYREVGITGILESYEPDGKVEKWNVGKLECWKSGKMEKWKTGIMECWNVGKLMIL